MKCFKNAGEELFEKRAYGYFLANKAHEITVKSKNELEYIQKGLFNYGNYQKHEKKTAKRNL